MDDVIKKYALKINQRKTRGTIIVGSVRITVTFIDVVSHKEAFGYSDNWTSHFYHNRYRVSAVNTVTKKRASWYFHDSARNTQDYEPFPDDLGYAILCSIRNDYFITSENYPTFNAFCDEFGYDHDSRSHEKVYKKIISLGDRLNTVFDEEVIMTLPQ